MKKQKLVFRGLVFYALIGLGVSFAHAGTIIKLNLGEVGPDVGMSAGILATINDGDAATTGDQDTNVEFTGFLDGFPDILPKIASFSMHNLVEVGAANVFGTLVIQNFSGGSFELYDPVNTLLLSGHLNNSALSGVIGPPGTGALFTTTFGPVTGGTLAPLIASNSLSLSMNMTNVNGGAGFAVTGGGVEAALAPFVADAAVNIAGDPVIPEPATLTLFILGSTASMAFGWRRRRLV